MNEIISKIGNGETVEIQTEPDEICLSCPNLKDNKCVSEQNIISIDNNVIKYLNIAAKTYSKAELDTIIKSKLTEELFNKICSDCEWNEKGICRFILVYNG